MSLNSLLQSPDASQRTAVKAHISKWQRTGLLEGLRTETEMAGMAQLLENQARQLVRESSQTGTAEGSEEWAGVALPLVRRIFAEFAAKEFVSVQPMNLPSGLVFYLDFKYGTARPGFNQDKNQIHQVIHLHLQVQLTLYSVSLMQTKHLTVFMAQVVSDILLRM
jgi:hypothetical protein